MTALIVRPNGNETEKQVEIIKKNIRGLFEPDEDEIKSIIHYLSENVGKFTAHNLTKQFKFKPRKAKTVHRSLLHILHMYKYHELSSEDVSNQLLDLGCDKSKVISFVSWIEELDERTMRLADGIYHDTTLITPDLHIKSIKAKVTYESIKDKKGVVGIMPVAKFRMELENSENENETFTFGIPASKLDEFLDDVNSIINKVRGEINTFKNEMKDGDIVVSG
ncbi:MAG: hypothetical protein M1507_04950 [Candidatus Thermoplasmatota archaeon]|nr:hypothetical protein [Candidatus Thermoplasmatota archaeon]